MNNLKFLSAIFGRRRQDPPPALDISPDSNEHLLARHDFAYTADIFVENEHGPVYPFLLVSFRSDFNFMAAEVSKDLKLEVEPYSGSPLDVPGQGNTQPIGSLVIRWKMKNGHEVYQTKFMVIPTRSFGLLLGRSSAKECCLSQYDPEIAWRLHAFYKISSVTQVENTPTPEGFDWPAIVFTQRKLFHMTIGLHTQAEANFMTAAACGRMQLQTESCNEVRFRVRSWWPASEVVATRIIRDAKFYFDCDSGCTVYNGSFFVVDWDQSVTDIIIGGRSLAKTRILTLRQGT
ncbi:hypothetical protein P170DRAFT_438210 [Aspergillus steynii IBT 23096]|uniref:Uncharacterized protein n=1 Tax=Aspergillus steynii IBT 23096 TaxID=1392250 RepID=A0A2I2G0K8_9EURO|nr:uncharacterized protein P170DRAFT_438210 [Aspergillus steynii IBT 23096]PLB46408.1 hypothetical protein P170DRAFT_438210 [Aspergillus steynii IBT 23096]